MSAPARMSLSMARLPRKGKGAMRKTPRSGPIETERRALPETAGFIRTEVPPTAIGFEAELAELAKVAREALMRVEATPRETP